MVILAGLPWDFASLDQFLARVHRLTSRRPVTVYVVLTEGSLDERKWKLLQDKTASAELAIDGHLVAKKQKPISQQEILDELKRKGLPVAETIAESDIFDTWRKMRPFSAGRAIRDRPAGADQNPLIGPKPMAIRKTAPQPYKQLSLFEAGDLFGD